MAAVSGGGLFGLRGLLSLIDRTFPLPRRFRSRLPAEVAELSRLLTSARGEREGAYLNRPNLLSAYLRYFLPWNVFRLFQVFEQTGCPAALRGGDAVTDLGSGPLTLPIALWMAFPALRALELEFRCVDKSAPALEAGKRLFQALSAGAAAGGSGEGGNPWRIKTIHDSLDAPIRGQKARLVSAVNALNEVRPRGAGPEAGAEKTAALLRSLRAGDGTILIVEPGNPQGGTLTAALRAALREKGMFPAAPCPHGGPCPLPGGTGPRGGKPGRGGKAKWCHFARATGDAPEGLRALSLAAGIPKERAVFSYLLATPAPPAGKAPGTLSVRVVSDPFPVRGVPPGGPGTAPGRPAPEWGRYGCSERGLVLLVGNAGGPGQAGPGTLLELPLPGTPEREAPRDPKTGALRLEL
ncbi:MAG: rRNA methyltransferase [Treponema sp.]|jgi:hypothetical protein|nr:rRNA methyltransferase [Treponema sp.]